MIVYRGGPEYGLLDDGDAGHSMFKASDGFGLLFRPMPNEPELGVTTSVNPAKENFWTTGGPQNLRKAEMDLRGRLLEAERDGDSLFGKEDGANE